MSKRSKDITGLLAADYRWPKRGDRLLKESKDWNRSVQIPNDEVSRHVHIWSGYMKAGSALIDVCIEDRYERNFLVYPILFNYRHGLELAMKWVIAQYGGYSSVAIGDVEHHDLWQLWKLCEQIVIEIGGEDDALPVVRQIIKDFHDLDKSALAFRYSRDKRGAPISLPDSMIDLENVRDVMEAVGHFFDGADGQLDANSSAVEW